MAHEPSRRPRTARRPARATAPRRPKPDARRVALEVLRAVRVDDAYANLVLPQRIRAAGLDARDAALATELASGTLRGLGLYDAVIASAARRPAEQIDPEVLDVLRMAAHQLLATRIPPHAVVDESVSAVSRLQPRATGFANGVLRAVTRRSPEEWIDLVGEGLPAREALAVRAAHPAWIVDVLEAALAREGSATELPDLLAADNRPTRPRLVALPGLVDVAHLRAQPEPDGAADRSNTDGPVSPLGAPAPPGDPARVPAVRDGRARVQDEGSQLAALALSRARPVAPGERWLDLCSGPGGKAALLAAEAVQSGAALVANEVAEHRAELVRRAVTVIDPAPEVRVGDGRRFGLGEGSEAAGRYDRVLLDAPCSGLGALRRRPEARWRKSPDDLPELVALQRKLLDAAVASLAPGGLLAYVTCSPHPAETTEQIEALLARDDRVVAVDTVDVLENVAERPLDLPATGWAQLWPHRHGTDAMFVQLLERRA